MSNRLVQDFKESLNLSNLLSNNKPKYDDDVTECMQFGICSVRPKPLKAIPYYYHF